MKSHTASLLSAPSPATQNCLPFYYSSGIRVPGQSSLHKSLLPFSTEIWFSRCRLYHPISGASMWSGDSTSRTGGWPSPAIPASKSLELVWKHAILYSLFYPLLVSANPYLIHWRTQTRFSHCLNLNFCQFSTKYKMHTELRAQPQHPHRLHSWAELTLYCNHPHTKFCNSLKLWKLKCMAVLLWPQLHIFPFHDLISDTNHFSFLLDDSL